MISSIFCFDRAAYVQNRTRNLLRQLKVGLSFEFRPLGRYADYGEDSCTIFRGCYPLICQRSRWEPCSARGKEYGKISTKNSRVKKHTHVQSLFHQTVIINHGRSNALIALSIKCLKCCKHKQKTKKQKIENMKKADAITKALPEKYPIQY